MPGLLNLGSDRLLWLLGRSLTHSVASDHRRVELVAGAHDGPLEVARLGIEAVIARGAAELIGLATESCVIVFEADDPVAGDAVFPAGTDGPAVGPMGLTARTGGRTDRIGDRQTVVHAGIAALDVEQVVLHGEARATNDGGKHIGAPGEHVVTRAERGVQERALVVEARDRAFHTEHVVVGLPIVADLGAAQDAGVALTVALPRGQIAERRAGPVVDELLVGPCSADVTADIKAGPVEQRLRIGGRLRVARTEIGGGSGAGRNQSGRAGEGGNQLVTHSTPRVL